MKFSTKLSDAMHISVYIGLGEVKNLTSAQIAESVKTNPAYVRQIMSYLKKAGLILTTRGQANPSLTRTPAEITMLDVYRAVEGDKPLLHLDTHVNPECGVAMNVQFAIGDYYRQIQQVAEEKMKNITLQDVMESYRKRVEEL